MTYDFDLFIIGAGSGGLAAAKRAAQYGVKVAIAEADRLGGTCVNRGCVPKKLMVYASRFASQAQEAAGYGWSFAPGRFSWESMITAINGEVSRLNGVYQQMMDSAEVTLYKGHARIVESHTVIVAGQKVTAEKILIAVGGKPHRPNLPGIELAITSNEIFQLAQQPKRLVIFGGGYIGCEFASIFNALGTEVTQVIRRDQVLRGFDEDIRTEVQAAMEHQGINIVTDELVSLEKTDTGLKVNLKNNPMVLADVVGLAALGRRPNLDHLGLENTRVELHQGAIMVDAHSQT
ncbi:MAG: FAD-dependent oxidoreductase, partial [Cyanobacteria bacterium J06642_11]